MRSLAVIVMLLVCIAAGAQKPKVLALYTEKTERDHVDFAHQAIEFFTKEAAAGQFEFSATMDWAQLDDVNLKTVAVVMWLDDEPHSAEQRAAFERYMEHGGGWMGFHASAYNDRSTGWPWFVQFLGGAIFATNNWPPLPAEVVVENKSSPVTRGLPGIFRAPANEWYGWKPNPRANKDVRVLVSLSPKNYPLGLKDTLTGGDIPVVWTNTRYRMLYVNMGHGDKIFSDATQNQLLRQGLEWVTKTK